jgi:nucleoside 2-deoxyribosyltransferase
MNVYFSCSLTGGRADEQVYAQIVDHLLDCGFEVPTEHLARPEVMALERVVDPHEVYQRDIHWIHGCDAMVAEVSTPSHGVGYELAYALGLKKPVLACYRHGVTVSKMITGNYQDTLRVLAYPDVVTLLGEIDVFLADLRGGQHPASIDE